MFKNLTIYRLTKPWELSPGQLEELLDQHPHRPPMEMAVESRGWVPVTPSGALVAGFENQLVFKAAFEQKLIPNSAVKRKTDDRVAALEATRGHKIGRKARREVADQVIAELLPKALTRVRFVSVWIDVQASLLYVESGSASRADDVTIMLRETLGELAITCPEPELPLKIQMTQWLANEKAPQGLDLGRRAELCAEGVEPAKISFANVDIEGNPELQSHLRAGLIATRVELCGSHGSFMVDDKGFIRSVRLEEPEVDDQGETDPDAAFEATMRVRTANLRGLLAPVNGVLGLSPGAN